PPAAVTEHWRHRVLCRCAGAVAGWVDDATFLSLQLHLLAPGQACTTVWLNAASQETQSEHAGVTSPLLRIYNEAAAHISTFVQYKDVGKQYKEWEQAFNQSDRSVAHPFQNE
ncbi:jg21853, partial [Pararge aegeria aegeria]